MKRKIQFVSLSVLALASFACGPAGSGTQGGEIGFGGGGGEAGSGSETGGTGGSANGVGVGGSHGVLEFPPWEPPAEPFEQVTDGDEFIVSEGGAEFVCRTTEHDVQQNYDEIMALGAAYADLKPGMVLQGNSVQDGSMTPVPLPRAPISLSIDLAVRAPMRDVEHPTSANIQGAIASLQREADSALGNLPTVPAQVQFSLAEVQSFEETSLSLDVHASYSGFLASGGLDAAFSQEQSVRQHTIVAKLYQPMYTITFADEAHATARDFFSEDLTTEDFEEQERLGTVSADNLPTFVKSVTYGRLVLFSVTSFEAESSTELSAAVRGSYMGFSANAETETKQRSLMSTATVEVLALGGSADVTNEAIKNGTYMDFFGPAPATTAVPLTYRINNLTAPRLPAVIGDATSYSRTECQSLDDACTTRLYQGKLYAFCTDEVTYLEASDRCEAFGKRLVRIDDALADGWILQEARLLNMSRFWIGAFLGVEGWSWQRDAYDPLTYTNWAPGEPNNYQYPLGIPSYQVAAGSGENCVEYRGDGALDAWNDLPCNIRRPYVCGDEP